MQDLKKLAISEIISLLAKFLGKVG